METKQMNLQSTLHQFCNDNELGEICCIIQFTIVNYITSHKSKNDWVYLSPELLDSFIGIGQEKVIKMLKYLAENSDAVTISYQTYCPKDKENKLKCEAINLEDYEEGDEIELNCQACNELHIINSIDEIEYDIDYEGNKSQILEELKISQNAIAQEITVLNTSENHINMLADILVSRLQLDKKNEPEAKKGVVKILSSVKDVTGLISGIGEDVSKTSSSIKNIIEDFTGVSSLKDIVK